MADTKTESMASFVENLVKSHGADRSRLTFILHEVHKEYEESECGSWSHARAVP